MEVETDEMLSFISVWNGLEIFINKTFVHYEKEAYRCIAELTQRKVHQLFIAKIKDIMSTKYSLLDKFITLSNHLDSTNSDNDIMAFRKIKDIRDKFTHGDNIDARNLPTADTNRLLRKYLKLHIEYEKPKQIA